MAEAKDKKYILTRDIIIPAGTEFDNYSNEAKEGHYFEATIGLHRDYAEFIRITDMDELLSCFNQVGEEKDPLFRLSSFTKNIDKLKS